MNRTLTAAAALLAALLVPSGAAAELRRVEMKTLGMD